jgi:hypothetical protein
LKNFKLFDSSWNSELNLEIVKRESVKISIMQLIGVVQIADRIDSNSDLNEEGYSSI